MNIHEYFMKTAGHGVLATADSTGKVNVAIFSRPHAIDEKTIAFIMADHLTHANLQSNPRAAFLFMEAGSEHAGKRFHLSKTKELKGSEISDPALKEKFEKASREYEYEKLCVVHFRVDRVLAMVGEDE